MDDAAGQSAQRFIPRTLRRLLILFSGSSQMFQGDPWTGMAFTEKPPSSKPLGDLVLSSHGPRVDLVERHGDRVGLVAVPGLREELLGPHRVVGDLLVVDLEVLLARHDRRHDGVGRNAGRTRNLTGGDPDVLVGVGVGERLPNVDVGDLGVVRRQGGHARRGLLHQPLAQPTARVVVLVSAERGRDRGLALVALRQHDLVDRGLVLVEPEDEPVGVLVTARVRVSGPLVVPDQHELHVGLVAVDLVGAVGQRLHPVARRPGGAAERRRAHGHERAPVVHVGERSLHPDGDVLAVDRDTVPLLARGVLAGVGAVVGLGAGEVLREVPGARTRRELLGVERATDAERDLVGSDRLAVLPRGVVTNGEGPSPCSPRWACRGQWRDRGSARADPRRRGRTGSATGS